MSFGTSSEPVAFGSTVLWLARVLAPKSAKIAGVWVAYAATMKRSTQSRKRRMATGGTPVDRGDLKTALKVAQLLWPEFVQERGATFVAFRRPIAHRPFESYPGNLVGAELFVNHVQVLRLGFNHSLALMRAPFWRRTHQDFARACRLAELAGEAWAAKLRRDFPDKDFAVLVGRDDDPSVNFYEIRTPRDVFYSVEKTPPGTLLVIRSRSGERVGSIRPPVAGERRPRPSIGMVGSFTLAVSPVWSPPTSTRLKRRTRR